MGCFTIAFFGHLLIHLVVILAVFAAIQVIVPWALNRFGGPGPMLAQLLNIFLWAVCVILVIVTVLPLFECLLGSSGGF